jgi:hypothetical protein
MIYAIGIDKRCSKLIFYSGEELVCKHNFDANMQSTI